MGRWGWSGVFAACALVLSVSACSSDDKKPALPKDIPPISFGTRPTVPATGPRTTVPEPQPSGAFTTIASMTNDGLQWTLSQAPATMGGTCFKLATAPAIPLVQDNEQCYLEPDTANPGSFNVEFPFESYAKTGNDIVVGTAFQPITDAQFQFVDGSKAAPVFIDKNRGIAVWAGKSRPFLGSATLESASDGTFSCGPGDTTAAQQLAGKNDKQLLEIRQFPWACSG